MVLVTELADPDGEVACVARSTLIERAER
jgi:hypothetical protein